MKGRVLASLFLTAALGLVAPAKAQAVPIGAFSWEANCGSDPLLGQCFTVENFSDFLLPSLGLTPQSFENVVIQLTTTTGPQTLSPSLGSIQPWTVPAGSFEQTTEDLTSFVITFATLTFDFALPGTIVLLDESGPTPLVVTGLSAPDSFATIDFTPVPEPSTLLLVSGGLALIATQRKRQARRPRSGRA